MYQLRDEKEKIEMQIEFGKRQTKPFTVRQISQIEARLNQMKQQWRRLYQNRLKQLDIERNRIIKSQKQVMGELEQLLKNEIKLLKKKNSGRQTKKKENKTDITPL